MQVRCKAVSLTLMKVLLNQFGQYLSQVNSLELIGGLLNKYWLDAAENRARATVIGLRNYDQANGKRLTTDISASTATEATGFSVDAYIDAESTMKRELRGRGAILSIRVLQRRCVNSNFLSK